MDYKYIEKQLLEALLSAAETSLEEEKILRTFFSQRETNCLLSCSRTSLCSSMSKGRNDG